MNNYKVVLLKRINNPYNGTYVSIRETLYLHAVNKELLRNQLNNNTYYSNQVIVSITKIAKVGVVTKVMTHG